jgi:type I restriction enzyme S subunit
VSKWPRAVLGTLASRVTSGFACSKTRLVDSGVPHLRPFNINTNGQLNLSEVYQIGANEVPRGRAILEAGDILFNNTNSDDLVGKCAFVPMKMTAGFSNHITRVVIDPQQAEPAFIVYVLQRMWATGFFRRIATRWVNQSAVNTKALAELSVPVPPLDEQRRIVDILDRAAGIRRLRGQAQDTVRQLIPALFVKLFGDPATNPMGWPVLQLGNILADGPQNGLYRPATDYGRGTRILRIDSFYDGLVTDLEKLRRLEIDSTTVNKYRLRPGDIVINRVNSRPYLGKSAIIPPMVESVVFESNMMRITLDDTMAIPEYVIAFLQLKHARVALIANAKDAINQSSINQQDVTSLMVPIPPLPFQKQFSDRVQGLSHIIVRQAEATGRDEIVAASLATRLLA